MGDEAISLMTMERSTTYTYQTVETRNALIEAMQRVMGQLALVTINLNLGNGGRVRPDEHEVAALLLECLRPLVRRNDQVFLLTPPPEASRLLGTDQRQRQWRHMHFLLLGATIEGGQIVRDRLWDALLWRIHNTFDGEFSRLCSITAGHSAYPEPCETIAEVIEAADVVGYRADFAPALATSQASKQVGVANAESPAEEELQALSRRLGIPYLLSLPPSLPERVKRLISYTLARELLCYPIGRERKVLTVAMSNPQDRSALERLQQETGLAIFPVLTHPEKLQTAIEQLL